ASWKASDYANSEHYSSSSQPMTPVRSRHNRQSGMPVQEAKGHSRHREEINRRDHLPMVLEEAQPLLARLPTRCDSRQISGDRPLRNFKAQFQQLAVYSGGSPGRILGSHSLNELPHLTGYLG